MLKEISIDELQVGMYVHKIVEQRGNMKIKSQGKVTKKAIITQLRAKGILRLLVDTGKEFTPDAEPVDESLPQAKEPEPSIPAETLEATKTPQAPVPEVAETISFDAEINAAKKLHDKGKIVQKRMLDLVARGLPIDLKMPEEFTQQLVGSIDRNPNALMCLSKIREKDSYLLEHSLNVAILLANFGKYLKLDEIEVQELALAGFLHDVGKIKIPDEILHKPGRLTDPEMDVMRGHVLHGVTTLKDMGLPNHMIRTMAEHHERLDGCGYPDGLKGNEISAYGRMIAIADTYDAITANRVYKIGMSSQTAFKILIEESPIKYDKELVQKFVKCVGVYPVGSLVQLSNEQIGMVTQQNEDAPLKPHVKIFFSVRNETYLAIKDMDLKGTLIRVEKGVTPEDFGIDFNRFFQEKIAS